jgi:predicted RNA-binding protein with PIN domain
MRYIIDACNLIFAHGPLEEALEQHGFPAARQMLVSLLSRYAHAAKLEDMIAVFDGSEKGAHRPRQQREAAGKVLLVYASPRDNADRAIIEMVEGAARPGELTVVSGDKFVVNYTRRAGAHVLGCRAFIRQARMTLKRAADPLSGEDPRKFHGLSPREVEEWARYFGFTDDE